MEQAWTNTVRALAGGGGGAVPAAWPASRTRRVELWDRAARPGGHRPELGTAERALVRLLLARERCAGELAFVIGMELDEVHDLLAGLRTSGMVARRGLSWQCTFAGRAALCELPEPQPAREMATC